MYAIRSYYGNLRTPVVLAFLLMSLTVAFCAGSAHAATLAEEQNCLALNLYWEARGEGRSGMIAVGWVVLNLV